MRKIYPFTDDQARIVDTHDVCSGSHRKLDLYVFDDDNAVGITFHKEIDGDDKWW